VHLPLAPVESSKDIPQEDITQNARRTGQIASILDAAHTNVITLIGDQIEGIDGKVSPAIVTANSGGVAVKFTKKTPVSS
jgi:hypothetical protein